MKKLTLILVLFLAVSCATYTAKYDKNIPKTVSVNKEIQHTFFLIGDAGNAKLNETIPTLTALEKELNNSEGTTLFLGDNVYYKGMPKKHHPKRKLAEHRLQTQLDAVKNFKGNTIFLAGNHDWFRGLNGVKRQQKMVEKALGKQSFLPNAGCGLDHLKINDDITLILIDSRWFLTDWDDEPKINEDCDIKTRERFFDELNSLFKKNRYKKVVVAMHHPIFSNGHHGGYFSVKDHLKPVPVIGSLKYFVRSNAGIQSDIFQKQYSEFVSEIKKMSKDFQKNIVFVAGHEHNLQYIEKEGFKQIVSGSGSKTEPAKIGRGAKFTYGNLGYAKLIFYKDGSAVAEYYSANKEDGNTLLFSKEIIKPTQKIDLNSFDFSEYNQHKDSVLTSVYSEGEVEKSKLYQFLWGKFHRKKYGIKVKVPVLELDKVFCGLKPIRKGGGMQTNSLRLEDKNGHQYALRSMRKDGSRLIGDIDIEGTIISNRINDIFTTAHPFSAFVVPDMAEASGIYHTNPKLYYMPKQPALGKYNQFFDGGLYLLEERPAGNREDLKSFGNSKKIISSFDVLKKIRKNNKHFVDERFTVRSRLFDMVIGDWDRHEDQWRFASFKTDDGKTMYRPIPRDRDQVFSKYDGLIIPLVKKGVPMLKKMQSMDYDVKNVKWNNYNPRFFDTEFLNELTLNDWLKEAEYIQQHLTDEVIENSIKQFPKGSYKIDGEELIAKVKSRRDKLKNIARKYYKILAKKVQIIGTDKDDEFIVERLNDDETSVEVYQKKELIYKRIFKTKETKEIQLYGLNGDDKFKISGNVSDGILIRLIGGHNHDVYEDTSSVSGWSRKTKIYDYKSKKSTVKGGKELDDLRKDDYYQNSYNHKDVDYNTTVIMPTLGSNPDDGFFFGATAIHTRYGFKKRPFSSRYKLKSVFYNATNGFDVRFSSEHTKIIGNWSLALDAIFTSENYTNNFFGWGNNTVFNKEKSVEKHELDFYRVKKSEYSFSPSLMKRFNAGSIFKISGIIEGIELESTKNRLIENTQGITSNLFERTHFLGGEFNFNHKRTDDENFPTKGMNFDVYLGAKAKYKNPEYKFGYFKGSWAFYTNLQPNNRSVVWATEVGSQINFGNDFEFYQGATLGGNRNLRGFNNQRFTGKRSFYHSNDIRFRLAKFKAGIPMKVGLTTGFDYGKVWSPYAENRGIWHTSYGGSVWFNGLDMFTLNISYFQGNKNEGRFAFGLGFGF